MSNGLVTKLHLQILGMTKAVFEQPTQTRQVCTDCLFRYLNLSTHFVEKRMRILGELRI